MEGKGTGEERRPLPRTRSNIESYECAVCRLLLFDPVTISCGHTACRRCLAHWLATPQTQHRCPAGCASQIPRELPRVNVLLNQKIKNKFPVEIHERKLQVEEEERIRPTPVVPTVDRMYRPIGLPQELIPPHLAHHPNLFPLGHGVPGVPPPVPRAHDPAAMGAVPAPRRNYLSLYSTLAASTALLVYGLQAFPNGIQEHTQDSYPGVWELRGAHKWVADSTLVLLRFTPQLLFLRELSPATATGMLPTVLQYWGDSVSLGWLATSVVCPRLLVVRYLLPLSAMSPSVVLCGLFAMVGSTIDDAVWLLSQLWGRPPTALLSPSLWSSIAHQVTRSAIIRLLWSCVFLAALPFLPTLAQDVISGLFLLLFTTTSVMDALWLLAVALAAAPYLRNTPFSTFVQRVDGRLPAAADPVPPGGGGPAMAGANPGFGQGPHHPQPQAPAAPNGAVVGAPQQLPALQPPPEPVLEEDDEIVDLAEDDLLDLDDNLGDGPRRRHGLPPRPRRRQQLQ